MKKLVIIHFLLTNLNTMAQTDNKHPMKIAMVGILVEDPAKAHKHYTEILGFESYMFQPENYIAIVQSPLDKKGTLILLEPLLPGGFEPAKTYNKALYDAKIPCMSFSAEDIMKTYEELKSKGVTFLREPKKIDFGWEAVFDDDNGNYIQLLQINE